MKVQTKNEIRGQMRSNANAVLAGFRPQPLYLDPLPMAHDPLFDKFHKMVAEDGFNEMSTDMENDEHDRQVILDLLEGSETPAGFGEEG